MIVIYKYKIKLIIITKVEILYCQFNKTKVIQIVITIKIKSVKINYYKKKLLMNIKIIAIKIK